MLAFKKLTFFGILFQNLNSCISAGKAVVGKRRVKAVPRQIVEGGGAQRGADPRESRNEGAATGEGGLIHCMDSTDGSILRTFADSQQAVEFWLDADATPATKRRVAGVLLYNSRMERTFYGFRWEQEQPPADALARTLEQSQARTLEQPQVHAQAHALAQAQPHAHHKGQSQSRTAGERLYHSLCSYVFLIAPQTSQGLVFRILVSRVSGSCIECALIHLTVDYPRHTHLTNLSLSRGERSMYLMAPDCVLRDMQLHVAHHGNNRLKRLPRGLSLISANTSLKAYAIDKSSIPVLPNDHIHLALIDTRPNDLEPVVVDYMLVCLHADQLASSALLL